MPFEITITQAIPSARELIDNLEYYGAKINNRPLIYLQTISLISGINLTSLHAETCQLLGNEMALLHPTSIAQRLQSQIPHLTLNAELINSRLEQMGYQYKIFGKAKRKRNGTLGKPTHTWVLTELGAQHGKIETGTHANKAHTKTGYHHNPRWKESIIPLLLEDFRKDELSGLYE